MTYSDDLQEIGLTEIEAKIYLLLLKSNELTASDIAKKSNTNRTFTYDLISNMQKKGLISYNIKDNKKYFRAANPNHLLELLKQKEDVLKSIIPDLQKLTIPDPKAPYIEVFSSKQGVRTALNLLLKDTEISIQGSISDFKKIMDVSYDIWTARRKHARISTSDNIDIPNAEVKFLDNTEETPTTTFITDSQAIIVLWSENPVAIRIDNRDIAKEYLRMFNKLWHREIKIYSGIDGVRSAWMELLRDTDEVLSYGLSHEFAEIYGKDFGNQWQETRVKNKVQTRAIAHAEPESSKYFSPRERKWAKQEIRTLRKEFCGPGCTSISKNLVISFLYTKKKYKVTVNSNKEVIEIQKEHFEKLWKLANKLN